MAAVQRGEDVTTILFDGRNHPPAATLIADGIAGGLLYCGTPASGKDFTAAQYADYKAHKLITIMGYENTTTDINGGYPAGQQHAAAFLADCRAKRVSFTEPALSTVDEHVTAANLPLAMNHHRGFRDGLKAAGWTGPIGIYGFSEVLAAAHAAGNADFYFGAGSRASLPPYTNIWQDNTGTIQVAGAADDRDVVLIPLPTEDNVTTGFNSPDTDPGPGKYGHDLLNVDQLANSGTVGFAALAAKLDAQAKQLTAIATAVNAVDADVKSGANSVLAALASGETINLTAEQVADLAQRIDAGLPGYTVNITPQGAPS